jgi:hypothetical protein
MVIGCSTISINYNFDPAADFSGLRTYDWMPREHGWGDHTRAGAPGDQAILDSRVKLAVDNQLAAKGYVKQGVETPDFLLAYHVMVEEKKELRTTERDYRFPSYTYRGPGRGRRYYDPGGFGTREWETREYVYTEGTLMLDIVDAETSRLIWRGSAQTELKASLSPQKRQKRLNTAVEQMLSHFPPQ